MNRSALKAKGMMLGHKYGWTGNVLERAPGWATGEAWNHDKCPECGHVHKCERFLLRRGSND